MRPACSCSLFLIGWEQDEQPNHGFRFVAFRANTTQCPHCSPPINTTMKMPRGRRSAGQYGSVVQDHFPYTSLRMLLRTPIRGTMLLTLRRQSSMHSLWFPDHGKERRRIPALYDPQFSEPKSLKEAHAGRARRLEVRASLFPVDLVKH